MLGNCELTRMTTAMLPGYVRVRHIGCSCEENRFSAARRQCSYNHSLLMMLIVRGDRNPIASSCRRSPSTSSRTATAHMPARMSATSTVDSASPQRIDDHYRRRYHSRMRHRDSSHMAAAHTPREAALHRPRTRLCGQTRSHRLVPHPRSLRMRARSSTWSSDSRS
jgi:hypothetical protein